VTTVGGSAKGALKTQAPGAAIRHNRRSGNGKRIAPLRGFEGAILKPGPLQPGAWAE